MPNADWVRGETQ